MGFSLTSTHLIFFITAISLAGIVSGIFISVTMNISNEFSKKGQSLADEINIDFQIINDPDNIPETSGYYIFYIKNTGENKIVTDNETFQIFIDGNLISKSKYYLTPDHIYPYEVAEIHVDNSTISSGTHKLKAVGPYGISDTFIFTI
ncbi:flagellar protein G [Thermococci archaeon]|nr:MAG: flagellar protein G [Thermococci archaeon]